MNWTWFHKWGSPKWFYERSGRWLPWLAVVAAVVLLARAVWGLSAWRWRISVIALGFLETGFGLLAVLLVAIGFWIE